VPEQRAYAAANCKSVYTKTGKYIGRGEPPAGHYWTKRNAEEAFEKKVLRQKQADMVKKKTTPPQPAQKKRKKTVQAPTLAEPLIPSILAALDNSDISKFSDSESGFTVDERTVSTCADKTNISERTVNTCADKTNSSERTVIEFFDKTNSSKSSRWDIDSLDLDLEHTVETEQGTKGQKTSHRGTPLQGR
jgi:hypothetical protein